MNRPLHIEIDRTLGTGLPVNIVDPTTGDSLGAYPSVVDAYHAKVLMEGGTDGISQGASGIRTDLNPGGIGANPTVDGTSGVGGIQTPAYDEGFTTPFTQHWNTPDIPPAEAITHVAPRW